jgi:integrase
MAKLTYLGMVSKSSSDVYRARLKNFFRVIFPDEPLFARKKGSVPIEVFQKFADAYFAQKQKQLEIYQKKKMDGENIRQKKLELFQEDADKFFITIKEFAPCTIRDLVSSVRVFLEENNVEFSHRFWRRYSLRIKGSGPLTHDRPPSKKEFRSILSHLDCRGKALFLLLASSGMRIGEALKLKVSDIDLSKDHPKISIPGSYTKTGNSRITFCSSEAKAEILEFLKVREKSLSTAVGRSWRYGKDIDDRLFSFEPGTAKQIWENALIKSGLDLKDYGTGKPRLIYHVHVLRKFFRSQLGTYRTSIGETTPKDVIECLMGHDGYLDGAYRRIPDDELEKYYSEGEPGLLVFSNGGDFTKIRQEFENRDENLAKENRELKENLSKLSTEFSALKQSWERRKDYEQKWFDGVDYDLIQAVVDEIKKRKQLELQKEWQQAERRNASEDREIAEKARICPKISG